MKKENGMNLIATIFTIIIIIVLAILAYYLINNISKDKKVEDIKANMLLIKGKCKVLEETNKVNNNSNNIKGRKVSEMKEDIIISEFLPMGILDESKLDKYYVLSDEDLSNMGLDIKNEKNTYYIVSYESNEVFITKGYKNVETNEIVYKLEE